jgi:hypothetical protein
VVVAAWKWRCSKRNIKSASVVWSGLFLILKGN